MKKPKKIIFSKITTPRLIIRPIKMDDANAYFAAEQASFNELVSHWRWVKEDKSVEDINKFIRDAEKCHKQESPIDMYFSILTKNNQFIGLIWLPDIDWCVPKFEILYWLDIREVGHGYMTEAVNALTRACFTLYEAKRVQIQISINNKKSRNIVERLGFNFEGEMKNCFINFVSNNVSNGLLYACCSIEKLPPLDIHIFK